MVLSEGRGLRTLVLLTLLSLVLSRPYVNPKKERIRRAIVGDYLDRLTYPATKFKFLKGDDGKFYFQENDSPVDMSADYSNETDIVAKNEIYKDALKPENNIQEKSVEILFSNNETKGVREELSTEVYSAISTSPVNDGKKAFTTPDMMEISSRAEEVDSDEMSKVTGKNREQLIYSREQVPLIPREHVPKTDVKKDKQDSGKSILNESLSDFATEQEDLGMLDIRQIPFLLPPLFPDGLTQFEPQQIVMFRFMGWFPLPLSDDISDRLPLPESLMSEEKIRPTYFPLTDQQFIQNLINFIKMTMNNDTVAAEIKAQMEIILPLLEKGMLKTYHGKSKSELEQKSTAAEERFKEIIKKNPLELDNKLDEEFDSYFTSEKKPIDPTVLRVEETEVNETTSPPPNNVSKETLVGSDVRISDTQTENIHDKKYTSTADPSNDNYEAKMMGEDRDKMKESEGQPRQAEVKESTSFYDEKDVSFKPTVLLDESEASNMLMHGIDEKGERIWPDDEENIKTNAEEKRLSETSEFQLYVTTGKPSMELVSKNTQGGFNVITYMATKASSMEPASEKTQNAGNGISYIATEIYSTEPALEKTKKDARGIEQMSTGAPSTEPASEKIQEGFNEIKHLVTGTPSVEPASEKTHEGANEVAHMATGTPSMEPASEKTQEGANEVAHMASGTPSTETGTLEEGVEKITHMVSEISSVKSASEKTQNAGNGISYIATEIPSTEPALEKTKKDAKGIAQMSTGAPPMEPASEKIQEGFNEIKHLVTWTPSVEPASEKTQGANEVAHMATGKTSTKTGTQEEGVEKITYMVSEISSVKSDLEKTQEEGVYEIAHMTGNKLSIEPMSEKTQEGFNKITQLATGLRLMEPALEKTQGVDEFVYITAKIPSMEPASEKNEKGVMKFTQVAAETSSMESASEKTQERVKDVVDANHVENSEKKYLDAKEQPGWNPEGRSGGGKFGFTVMRPETLDWD